MNPQQSKRLLEKEDRMVAQALKKVGLRVKSIYDLVNSKQTYPQAIPILIDLLPKVRHDRIKEGVARALTAKEARPIAARPLMDEFRAMNPETESARMTKWAIGNALSVVADDSVFEEMSALVRDKSHGWARSMLALALCNMQEHRDQAIQLLLDLLRDKDVGVQAMIALGNLHVKRARAKIEAFLRDQDSWVRQEAKRALAKIDKAK